jgi:penicillin-binding protein 2
MLIVLLTACSPSTQEQSVAPLPTLASLPSPTPPSFTLDAAERVARYYLEAWKNSDFATMHSLIAFASREGMPLDEFVTLYQSAHTTMTLESLDYTITSQMMDNNATMMVFNYDMTFETDLVGAFADTNRTLRLVFDSTATEWRIAWSQADIFAAMGNGGGLRLEPRIPSRANIYDSDGNILADQNARVVNVSIVKRDIVAYETCLGSLAQALGKPYAEISTILDQRGNDQLSDMGTIEAATYVAMHEQLERECGARFRDQPARRYANGTLMPHILGNVGYPAEADIPAVEAAGFNQDSILGSSGIERSWDETLRGRPGGRLLIVAPNGNTTILAEGASRPSESVWLTIDTDLQAFINNLLSSAYQSAAGGWATTSRGASAVVLDVNTGAILALVSYPTYDGNAFNPFPSIGRDAANVLIETVQNDSRVPLLNRPTLGAYPAGSTFKVIPAIAAADSGVYALDERYACSGIWNRDITRYDWLPGGHGTLTLAGSLTNSCNPYYYETGYRLDEADPYLLPSYARRFGLGSVTGLRDVAEASGTIIDPDWLLERGGVWRFSDAVNMAIGQGEVEVTPLQLTRVFAAIANGGDLYRPQLVQKAGILGEMPSYEMRPEILSNADIKEEVWTVIREGLCAVTSTNAGTAEYQFRLSPLQNIGICGKTGTAQSTGAGSPPHAWFAAYGPGDDPEVAVVVMVENAGEGSAVAAPLARDILEYYFFGEDFVQ